MLLTFGLTFPILTLIILMSMVLLIIEWKVIINRYIFFAIRDSDTITVSRELEKSTFHILSYSYINFWIFAAILSTITFGLLIIDTLSDVQSLSLRAVTFTSLFMISFFTFLWVVLYVKLNKIKGPNNVITEYIIKDSQESL